MICTYGKISRCLVEGLRQLGVTAAFEPGRQPSPSPRSEGLTAPCFSSTTQYEVTIGGRKLIGSAQRRFDGMLLQHGSLLVGPEHQRILELLPDGRESVRERFSKALSQHTVSLTEATGGSPEFDDIASGLRAGFERIASIELADGKLTDHEEDAVRTLVRTKYSTDAWNFRMCGPGSEPGHSVVAS